MQILFSRDYLQIIKFKEYQSLDKKHSQIV
jgi:hypothetical protein